MAVKVESNFRLDPLGVFLALVFLAVIVTTVKYQDWTRRKPQTHCADPVYLDTVGHADSTGWIYGCSDGSMVELPSPLPSAPVGNASAWGQR